MLIERYLGSMEGVDEEELFNTLDIQKYGRSVLNSIQGIEPDEFLTIRAETLLKKIENIKEKSIYLFSHKIFSAYLCKCITGSYDFTLENANFRKFNI